MFLLWSYIYEQSVEKLNEAGTAISTTKLFLAEMLVGAYNSHRWISKPEEIYSTNSKRTCKPPELHTIMKKCNGTGLVLKYVKRKITCGKDMSYQYEKV